MMTDCRYFNGYKPCGKAVDCTASCRFYDQPRLRLLIIHLGAMGAVVRATSLLRAIKRKYPSSHLTWVTEAPMQQLLQSHPLVDRVLTTSPSDQLTLRALQFETAFVIDKSLVACGLLRLTQVDQLFGFDTDGSGAILPATSHAEELWELGLDDHAKFFVNTKPETQLLCEALDLGPWQRDEYNLPLRPEEALEVQKRQRLWRMKSDQAVIGFNTGCGPLMPAKKWTVEYHRELIQRLLKEGYRNLVLLGGPDDQDRNQKIGEGLAVIQSPTDQGLRDGYVSISACDVVITGDSLGMHLAIAARRQVIAWFGPSCEHEIDLYDRGISLKADVACSPCWKRSCQKEIMCYDRIDLDRVVAAVQALEVKIAKEPERKLEDNATSRYTDGLFR